MEFFDQRSSNEGQELSVEEYVDKVALRIIQCIGQEFYEEKKEQIIFAIAVDCIECWLLALYYNDNKKAKTVGGLRTLNQVLQKKEGFMIDKKNPEYYRLISKKYWKHKTLMKLCAENPSLRIFIENLQEKNIYILKDEDW